MKMHIRQSTLVEVPRLQPKIAELDGFSVTNEFPRASLLQYQKLCIIGCWLLRSLYLWHWKGLHGCSSRNSKDRTRHTTDPVAAAFHAST